MQQVLALRKQALSQFAKHLPSFHGLCQDVAILYS